MAKQMKTRKPVSAKTKGLICLLILCALTVAVSVLALGGWRSGENGMNVLLPWVPTKPADWPQSLPLTKALNGGNFAEYTVALEEGVTMDDVVKKINARLDGMSESDRTVTANGDTLRVEMRDMEEDRLNSVRNTMIVPAKLELRKSDGTVLLTEKDVKSTLMTVNDRQTLYVLQATLTNEGAQKMKEADAEGQTLTVYLDNESVTTASYDGSKVNMNFLTTNYNAASNVAFFLNTGSVYAKLTLKDSGQVPATAAAVKTVVFFAGAVLLIGALVYLCLARKLTGFSGIWTVWCTLLLGLFFVATLVVPAVYALNVGCLIAVLLGILLAVYTAVTRADAISANIGEGLSPKQASRLGFKGTEKQVWIVHGAAIVLAMILMIFPVAKSTGYTLAAMVCGSAITLELMRAFQSCFTSLTGKVSLFGKAK